MLTPDCLLLPVHFWLGSDQAELYRFVVPFSGDRWASSVFNESSEETVVSVGPRRRLRRAAAWAVDRVRRMAS
jgi:hypothetical protein